MLKGIPQLYENMTLDNFEGDVIKARALEALRAKKNIFITGIPGAGKSHLGIGLLRQWHTDVRSGKFFVSEELVRREEQALWAEVERRRRVGAPPGEEVLADKLSCQRHGRFLQVPEFFLELRDTIGTERRESDVLDYYAKRDLLVLDDLGAGGESPYSRDMLLLLINRRLEQLRQTIVNSNLSLPLISERIDDRLASRLAASVVLVMPERDRRVGRSDDR